MGIFKRKKKDKYYKKLKKQRNRTNRGYTIVAVLILSIVLIIGLADSFSKTNFDVPAIAFFELKESDIQMSWAARNTNIENLKSKLEYAGLNDVSKNITPITIADSTTNNPIHNMQLNFDEIGYLANMVLSFNSSFKLSEITWSLKKENVAAVEMIYSVKLKNRNQNIEIFFKQITNYDFINHSLEEISFESLNMPNSDLKKVKDYGQISGQLLPFIFKTTYEDETNKPLACLLGFEAVEILNYGIKFKV